MGLSWPYWPVLEKRRLRSLLWLKRFNHHRRRNSQIHDILHLGPRLQCCRSLSALTSQDSKSLGPSTKTRRRERRQDGAALPVYRVPLDYPGNVWLGVASPCNPPLAVQWWSNSVGNQIVVLSCLFKPPSWLYDLIQLPKTGLSLCLQIPPVGL